MADTLKTIKCPACHRDMMKVYMPELGINIDVCADGCGGIYFDNREFKHFDEKHENIDQILNALQGKTFIEVDTTLPRTCPVCGAKMVKNFSSIKRQIEVDECYSCGGKFLDNGELEKIRDEFNTEAERSDATMKFVYATMGQELNDLQRHSPNRSLLRKLFDSLTGY